MFIMFGYGRCIVWVFEMWEDEVTTIASLPHNKLAVSMSLCGD